MIGSTKMRNVIMWLCERKQKVQIRKGIRVDTALQGVHLFNIFINELEMAADTG